MPLLAAGQVGDLFYYTTPLVTGESLRAKLARNLRRVRDRAGVHEARTARLCAGLDRKQAVDYYEKLVALWKNADPELQPIVKDAHARIARLSGEH